MTAQSGGSAGQASNSTERRPDTPWWLPVGDVVLCSDPHAAPGRLPGAAAAWLRVG